MNLLLGKPLLFISAFNPNNIESYTAEGNVTAVTDGNYSTTYSLDWGGPKTLFYRFETPVQVSSYKITRANTVRIRFRLYNSLGSLIYDVNLESADDKKLFEIDNLTDVKYFAITNEYSSPCRIAEFELFKGFDIKHLISSNNIIYTLDKNSQLVDINARNNLEAETFQTRGITDLTEVSEELGLQLQSPMKILTWTNNSDTTGVKFLYNQEKLEIPKLELTVSEYKPILTLHEPEIVTMTDIDNPLLHIEGFRNLVPYCESESPNLLILSQSKPNIYTNVIPNPQLILPKADIQFKMLDKVLSFSMTATEQNKGLIRIIFSVDGGNTWQTYDEDIQDFKEINIQDLDVVENEGMTVPVFNSIGERWNDIIKQNKIRFGYYLKIEELADVAEVDKLDVTIDALGSWDSVIHGVDYNYKYDNEKIYVELYRDGSYKVNYI